MNRGLLRVHPLVKAVWTLTAGAWRGYTLLSVACIGEGVAMMLAGPRRFPGGHWAPVFALGGPAWFGLGFFLVGVAIAVAPLRGPTAVRAALLGGATVHLLLMFIFAGAVPYQPTANPLGAVIYLVVGLLYVSHRDIYRITPGPTRVVET